MCLPPGREPGRNPARLVVASLGLGVSSLCLLLVSLTNGATGPVAVIGLIVSIVALTWTTEATTLRAGALAGLVANSIGVLAGAVHAALWMLVVVLHYEPGLGASISSDERRDGSGLATENWQALEAVRPHPSPTDGSAADCRVRNRSGFPSIPYLEVYVYRGRSFRGQLSCSASLIESGEVGLVRVGPASRTIRAGPGWCSGRPGSPHRPCPGRSCATRRLGRDRPLAAVG